ncbi:MAG: YifB family Mg chelatase-like AAA ATPase [Verrucomicrobiota bacterium]|nr:YifB family Mg chelatase-like AAA ATPase [Verrucomicrobiota bacterium]
MLSKVRAAALHGIEAIPVEVEVNVSRGLNRVIMVGLPDTAVRESQERVLTALANSGFRPPAGKVTINLAPADLRKEGPSFDLPLALGLLGATRQLDEPVPADLVPAGELALNGALRPIKGALPIALRARAGGHRGLLLPLENAPEAAVVQGLDIFPATTLRQSVEFLQGQSLLPPLRVDTAALFNNEEATDLDMADVKGQDNVKRALEIAAAGAHNLLLIGPPGSGKSMLAQRLPTILPPLTLEEALETTRVHSVTGQLTPGQALVTRRPFRAPHHTASDAGLMGGNVHPTPGEISLAHHGVLFLDELPEFRRAVLETMRQPLEEGRVTISRAAGAMTFPAQCMLIAAMNPTPDGKMPADSRSSPREIQNYLGRISGPLLDRIDLHVEAPPVQFRDMSTASNGEPSATIRARVIAARRRQQARLSSTRANARMTSRELKRHCALASADQSMLHDSMETLQLSARAHDRILKVARTIADLEAADTITSAHLAEAIQYRTLDRQLWG